MGLDNLEFSSNKAMEIRPRGSVQKAKKHWDRLLRMENVMSLSVFSKKKQAPQRLAAPSQKVSLADLKSKDSIYYNSFSAGKVQVIHWAEVPSTLC